MFEGIFTAVVSPMDHAGALISDLWEAQVRRQVDAGIHGLIIGGTTGEFYALTAAERIEQFKRAGGLLKRATPWLAGVNSMTTTDAIALAREASAAGASGLLLAAPPYVSPTQAELAEHCIGVSNATDLPIVLYNYPGRTGTDMGAEFLHAIKGHSKFVGMKESTGDMKRSLEILRDFPDIELCCGSEDLAIDFFAWGARMWICATSNFKPELILTLYDACVVRSDFKQGRVVALELASLMSSLEEGGKFIAAVKYACSRVGYCSPAVRAPLRLLTSDERTKLDFILDGLKDPLARSAA